MNRKFNQTYGLLALWIIALTATLGSLFFSEVMYFAPCSLCWYQRIFMYPLAVLFLIAFVKNDYQVMRYSLPLTILGILTASYHLLIYFKIIPETASPCVSGIPCSSAYIQWLGFITIPMLSLCAFVILALFQIYLKRIYK